jgi:HEAT repeat protein
MSSSPIDNRSAGPPVEANKIKKLASNDRLLRASAALAVRDHPSEGKNAADDTTDVLTRILETEWSTIPLDGRKALVDRLVSVLLEDEDPLVREIAAAALATQGEDGCTALLDHIDHPDTYVRSKVAISLGLLNSSANYALPRILHAATTERDSLVRGDLVRAMSRIDDPVLFPSLIEFLTRMDDTPDRRMLGDQVMSAMRERRTREWPEANKARPV